MSQEQQSISQGGTWDSDGQRKLVIGSGPASSMEGAPAFPDRVVNPFEDDQVDPETIRLLNNPNWVNAPHEAGIAFVPNSKRMGYPLSREYKMQLAAWTRQRDRGASEIFGRHPKFYKRNPEMTGPPYA